VSRSYLRSLAGLSLISVLLVLTVVNLWQRSRTEDRLEQLVDRIGSLETKLGGEGAERVDRPSGGVWGVDQPDYILAAMEDRANMLEWDADARLPDEAGQGGTLVLHFGSNPGGFNVIADKGTDVAELGTFTLPLLIDRHRGDTRKFAPWFAYSMVSPDDGLTYVFRLREDLVWQEPRVDYASGGFDWLRGERRVTAHDVVFMLDMTLDPQVTGAAPMRSYLEELDGYHAIDDFTFEIRFKQRQFSQRSVVLTSLWPMPEHLYAYDETGQRYDPEILGARFQDHWYEMILGCGPYLMTDFETGSYITLERNPRWPLGNNAFDKIVYLVLGDQNQPPRKLRTGELHLAYLQPGQYRTEVLEGPPDSPFKDGTLVQGEWWEYAWYYIGWNTRRVPFDDKRVRQAMSYAFDGDRMLEEVFLGLGLRNSGPLPQFMPYIDQTIEPWPFDLAASAALLDEAGWTDTDGDGIRDKEIDGERRPFEFDLVVYAQSNEYRTLATLFKEDLARVGVRVNIRSLEWGLLIKEVMADRNFDAVTLSWSGGPDPDFNQIWHSKQADLPRSSNFIGFADPEADRIIEQMAVTFDYDERIRLAHEFHALLAEEQPYTFFYTRKRPVFWQPALKNVRFGLVRPYRDHRAWYFGPAD